MDWLSIWGATSAVGFIFKPILEDLAKDAAKGWATDLFKNSLKNVLKVPEKKPLEKAAGKAVKEFLQLIQQELEDAEISEEELIEYTNPLNKFIKDKKVLGILGSPFNQDCKILDTNTLAQTWEHLNLKTLPKDFDLEKIAKRYLKKVNAIRREDAELREILNSETNEGIAEGVKELAGIVPDFDLRKYQEGILEQYGNLKLESIDTTGCAYNELKLWKIFIPQNVRESHEFLPKVYEIPKEYQKILKETGQLEEFSEEELEGFRRFYKEQPIRSVLEVVKDNECRLLVILGDPGSGKSTLLQFLALEWAEKPLKDLVLYPLPLLIELRTYARSDCKKFLEFCHEGNVFCNLNQHQLNIRLRKGNALVMFDGLDEIFDLGKREDVITQIHAFSNDYPEIKIIVTSRVFGYRPQRLRDAKFRHFMVQDLGDNQIEEFIQKWHNLTYYDESEKIIKQDRLKEAIKESASIGELAGNPLLLTMMAILNRNQELPRDRAELYNQASRVLLHQWDVERTLIDEKLDPKTIDFKDKQAVLRKIAFHMQNTEKGLAGNLIHSEDMEKILIESLRSLGIRHEERTIARVLIEKLRTRNFILCYLGADCYAFVHRTFLEFFCALEFVWQFEKEQRIGLEYLENEVYGKHWRDESWQEVLRLIAGMIDVKFVGKIINYLINQNDGKKCRNIFLAGDCLAEVRNRSLISEIAKKLFKKLEYLSEHGSIALTGKEGIFEPRSQAVRAISKIWKENNTFVWLKYRFQKDTCKSVRITALEELVRNYKDEHDVLVFLKNVAISDKHQDVRKVAIQELAGESKNDPEILSLLKNLAQNDENIEVRETAIDRLTEKFRDDPDTLLILKNLAQNDVNKDVRVTAIDRLTEKFRDDPDTLLILKNLAQNDSNENVRKLAITRLGSKFKNIPYMFEFLYNCAMNDPFESNNDLSYLDNPRIRSIMIIIKNYPDNPKVIELLKNRYKNDLDTSVRKYAEKLLEEKFKEPI
jgi:predicted NACHT family NTPase